MKFKNFINCYDNWNGLICLNDNNLKMIYLGFISSFLKRNGAYKIYKKYENYDIVSFGFYKNPKRQMYELTVRIKSPYETVM